MNTYKIKDNLFIKENKVISYETHVATIEDTKLVVHGKYSRTTSKHISYVASFFGLEIADSNKSMKGTFHKFIIGNVSIDEEKVISKNTSVKILNMLKDNIDYSVVISILGKKIPKKDLIKIDKPKNSSADLDTGVRILSRLEIF